jgi:hypothetical protein
MKKRQKREQIREKGKEALMKLLLPLKKMTMEA